MVKKEEVFFVGAAGVAGIALWYYLAKKKEESEPITIDSARFVSTEAQGIISSVSGNFVSAEAQGDISSVSGNFVNSGAQGDIQSVNGNFVGT